MIWSAAPGGLPGSRWPAPVLAGGGAVRYTAFMTPFIQQPAAPLEYGSKQHPLACVPPTCTQPLSPTSVACGLPSEACIDDRCNIAAVDWNAPPQAHPTNCNRTPLAASTRERPCLRCRGVHLESYPRAGAARGQKAVRGSGYTQLCRAGSGSKRGSAVAAQRRRAPTRCHGRAQILTAARQVQALRSLLQLRAQQLAPP